MQLLLTLPRCACQGSLWCSSRDPALPHPSCHCYSSLSVLLSLSLSFSVSLYRPVWLLCRLVPWRLKHCSAVVSAHLTIATSFSFPFSPQHPFCLSLAVFYFIWLRGCLSNNALEGGFRQCRFTLIFTEKSIRSAHQYRSYSHSHSSCDPRCARTSQVFVCLCVLVWGKASVADICIVNNNALAFIHFIF